MKSIPLQAIADEPLGRPRHSRDRRAAYPVHGGHPHITRWPADTEDELDTLAWRFIASPFTAPIYANWSIERRIHAYLAHHGSTHLINYGAALRNGILPTATWVRSRQGTREMQAADTPLPECGNDLCRRHGLSQAEAG